MARFLRAFTQLHAMNFAQLKYIVALDRFRHFAAAAVDSNVTQPTLSKQIQRLEEELGVIIFDRSKQPVLPTERGTRIIAQARIILEELNTLKSIATDDSQVLSGELRVGVLQTLAPYLLPLFLNAFSEAHPGLQIVVNELNMAQILSQLRSDQLDAGIVIAPTGASGFYETEVFNEPFVVYVSANHPLAAHSTIRVDQLNEGPLIISQEIAASFNALPEFKTLQQSFRDSINLNYENGSIETIRRFIETGGGATLLPELATLYMGPRRLEFVRHFAPPQPTRSINIITQRGFRKTSVLTALQQAIKANLPTTVQGNQSR